MSVQPENIHSMVNVLMPVLEQHSLALMESAVKVVLWDVSNVKTTQFARLVLMVLFFPT